MLFYMFKVGQNHTHPHEDIIQVDGSSVTAQFFIISGIFWKSNKHREKRSVNSTKREK